jgi:hypothetical protein
MGVSCNIARPKPKERDKLQLNNNNKIDKKIVHQQNKANNHHYNTKLLIENDDIRLAKQKSNYKSIEFSSPTTSSASSYAILNLISSWKFNKFLDNDVVYRKTSSSFLHSSFISYLITSSHNIVRQSLCSYATTSILLIILCYLTTSTVVASASSSASITDTIHPM